MASSKWAGTWWIREYDNGTLRPGDSFTTTVDSGMITFHDASIWNGKAFAVSEAAAAFGDDFHDGHFKHGFTVELSGTAATQRILRCELTAGGPDHDGGGGSWTADDGNPRPVRGGDGDGRDDS